MSKENEAVETIIRHKAKLIIENEGHTKHIEDFLSESGINFKDNPVEVFKIGAVDAMIFDVGAALNFAEFKRTRKRREMLEKIFPEHFSTTGK